MAVKLTRKFPISPPDLTTLSSTEPVPSGATMEEPVVASSTVPCGLLLAGTKICTVLAFTSTLAIVTDTICNVKVRRTSGMASENVCKRDNGLALLTGGCHTWTLMRDSETPSSSTMVSLRVANTVPSGGVISHVKVTVPDVPALLTTPTTSSSPSFTTKPLGT